MSGVLNIIHCGGHRTGSTALQAWLYVNRQTLLSHGYPVPTPMTGGGGDTVHHGELAWALWPEQLTWLRPLSDSLSDTQIRFHYRRILSSNTRLLLSSEPDFLFILAREPYRRRFLDVIGERTSLVAYSRKPSEIMWSLYQYDKSYHGYSASYISCLEMRGEYMLRLVKRALSAIRQTPHSRVLYFPTSDEGQLNWNIGQHFAAEFLRIRGKALPSPELQRQRQRPPADLGRWSDILTTEDLNWADRRHHDSPQPSTLNPQPSAE